MTLSVAKTCSFFGRTEVPTRFWCGKLSERSNLEDIRYEKIYQMILKEIKLDANVLDSSVPAQGQVIGCCENSK
jgi:hypothetical protein